MRRSDSCRARWTPRSAPAPAGLCSRLAAYRVLLSSGLSCSTLIPVQAEFQRQQMELLHLEEALQAARRRTADAGHQLAAMSERARAARLDIARRRQRLEEGQRDLAAWQARVAELAAEEGPRTAACARVRDALAREQRTQ